MVARTTTAHDVVRAVMELVVAAVEDLARRRGRDGVLLGVRIHPGFDRPTSITMRPVVSPPTAC